MAVIWIKLLDISLELFDGLLPKSAQMCKMTSSGMAVVVVNYIKLLDT